MQRLPTLSPSPPAAPEAALYLAADAEIGRQFRWALAIVAILLAGLGGWGMLARISGAVVAAGTVSVDGKRKAIQHLDGGVVRAIHVRDGDVVEAGRLLVTLDDRELASGREGLVAEIAARARQIESIEAELAGLVELQAKRLVPATRVSALQREAARISGDIARLTSERARTEAHLARREIRAPVAGRIHNLATHTVGGVVAPNATIAEIVPTGEGLVIEARVAPGDIDQVHADQPAEVRMTSLNQRTTPLLPAKVERISADLVREEVTGRDHYLVRIVPLEGAAHRLGGKVLVPGMPAEVLIETERRSALSYLTKPLVDQIARAFREE